MIVKLTAIHGKDPVITIELKTEIALVAVVQTVTGFLVMIVP